MFKNILFLCTGNICRSPAAEAILRKLRPDLDVISAGCDAMEGERVDETIGYILKKHDIECDHIARQVDKKMVHNADLILVMEQVQADVLVDEFPMAIGKVLLLGKWNENEEIEDPYLRSRHTYVKVYKSIKRNIDLWCEKVFK